MYKKYCFICCQAKRFDGMVQDLNQFFMLTEEEKVNLFCYVSGNKDKSSCYIIQELMT